MEVPNDCLHVVVSSRLALLGYYSNERVGKKVRRFLMFQYLKYALHRK